MRTVSGCTRRGGMGRMSELATLSLQPPPRGYSGLILEHDALLEQLVADPVGFGVVLRLARGLARGDPLLDPGFGDARRAALQEVLGVALQQPEHGAQRLELARRGGVALEGPVRELMQL